jgi:hypothetical protein
MAGFTPAGYPFPERKEAVQRTGDLLPVADFEARAGRGVRDRSAGEWH